MNGNFILPFLLTLIAGLATGIGSVISFFAKKENKGFLSLSLGFSAGVMLYVSFIEIFPKAADTLSYLGDKLSIIITVLSFFLGIAVIWMIDFLIPDGTKVKTKNDKGAKNKKDALLKTGLFTALAIAIHNLPEGLATFVSALKNPTLAIPIVVAISIHNIPEGIAVSVPVYYSTGSRKKAFWFSFLSGLTEPLGALIGYLLLLPILSDLVFGILFASVAGIMVFISLNDLIPTAREYGKHALMMTGLVLGMGVMAVSLILFI